MINIDFFRERCWRLIPYIATLYYLEIMYLMFIVNFIAGKIIAVGTGFALAILLSFHVVALFNRKNLNRKIQLFLMDLHFAYSAAFIVSRVVTGFTLSGGDIAVTVFRGITALIEIPMIIFLTDDLIIRRYR